MDKLPPLKASALAGLLAQIMEKPSLGDVDVFVEVEPGKREHAGVLLEHNVRVKRDADGQFGDAQPGEPMLILYPLRDPAAPEVPLDKSEDYVTQAVRALLNELHHKVGYRTDMIFEIASFVRAKLREDARRPRG